MAKTNFQYEKRQRELEKKKKADEKARRKLEAKSHPDGTMTQEEAEDTMGGADAAAAEQQNPA